MNGINGVHVFKDEQHNMLFFYLNASVAGQDNSAEYLKDFSVTSIVNTLNVAYESDLTLDYGSEINNQLYYGVQLNQD